MPSTNIKITAQDNTGAAFKSVNKSVGGLSQSVSSLKGALAGVGVAVGIGALIRLSKQSLTAADAIGKTADRLGITTTALQTYRFAAEQSGMSTAELDKSLEGFARRIGDAGMGIGTALPFFKSMNISLKDSNGRMKSTETLLSEVADKMKDMADPTEKISTGMAMFGRVGTKMVNMLQQGSGSLADLREQLVSTGGIIEDKFIREAEQANDSMNRLSKTFGAMTTKLLSGLSPAILKVTDGLLGLMGLDPLAGLGAEKLTRDLKEINLQIGEWQNKAFEMQKTIGGSNVVMNTLNARHAQLAGFQTEIARLVLKRAAIEERLAEMPKKIVPQVQKIVQAKAEETLITKAQNDLYGKQLSFAFQIAQASDSTAVIAQKKESIVVDTEKNAILAIQTNEIGYQNDKLAEQYALYGRGREGFAEVQAAYSESHAKMIEDTEKLAEAEKLANDQRIQNATATASSMIHSMKGFNKSWFQASQALSIAETIMNTHAAATSALKIQPPPVGIAFAAAITGMGLANVARIKSQSYQAREFGGPVSKGRSFLVGERGPELFTPNQSGNITANNQLGGPVNINFNIQANDAQGFDQLLHARRGMIVSMINRAMHERGRRGIV